MTIDGNKQKMKQHKGATFRKQNNLQRVKI